VADYTRRRGSHALYQGLTLVRPQRAEKELGFSPCGSTCPLLNQLLQSTSWATARKWVTSSGKIGTGMCLGFRNRVELARWHLPCAFIDSNLMQPSGSPERIWDARAPGLRAHATSESVSLARSLLEAVLRRYPRSGS